jgi:hypothetical protein
MLWSHAAAQELLDALFVEAAELDEWDPQRAQENERRHDTSVDFMGLNYRTCRWPLFEGHEPFYEKRYCGARTSSGVIIAPRMQGRPLGGALPDDGFT